MKKIIPKIVSVVLAAMLLFSSFSITASAANTEDKAWAFIFTTLTQYTDKEAKENTTRIYLKRMDAYSSYTFTARAYGAKTKDGELEACYQKGNTEYYYTVVTGEIYYLRNWVYENGNRFAAVQGKATQNFQASGVWSPDNTSGI